MSDTSHGLGCRPDLRDQRDDAHAFQPSRDGNGADKDPLAYARGSDVARGSENPPSLRSAFGPVRDQQRTSSCVGHACAALYEFLFPEKAPLSPWWAYYWARYRADITSWDDGCAIRDCLKELSARGICSEAGWPFKPSLYAGIPGTYPSDPASFNDLYLSGRVAGAGDPLWIAAAQLEGCTYHRVWESHVADCLAEGYPVVSGIPVYQSMFTNDVERTGAVPLPKGDDDSLLGGHAIVIVGVQSRDGNGADHDPLANARGSDVARGSGFLFRNSWGASWGDAGYGTLAPGYPLGDCWTARKP